MDVNRLMIVSGPGCVGKTTFISKITNHELPHIANQLGIQPSVNLTSLDTQYLNDYQEKSMDVLLLHYDFLTQLSTSEGRKTLLSLIQKSTSSEIITLFSSQNALYKCMRERVKQSAFRFFKNPSIEGARRIVLQRRKLKIYSRAASIVTKYNEWLDFASTTEIRNHYLLDSPEYQKLIPVDNQSIKLIQKSLDP